LLRCGASLYIPWMFPESSLSVPWTRCTVPWMLPQCSLNALQGCFKWAGGASEGRDNLYESQYGLWL
jgi:hypothetical protein